MLRRLNLQRHVLVTAQGSMLARWRRTITAAFGLGGIAISAWGPRLPAIKASLGIGTAVIGLLLAGITRRGHRAHPGLDSSARGGFVIVGLGIGLLDVMINVEGAAIEKAAGRTLMPMMHAAWSVGAVVGAGIGAACAALGIAPAAQLVAEAVLIAAVAVAMASGIPGGRRGPAEQRSESRRAALGQWLRGWLDWRLLLIGVVMLGCELGCELGE
jgi:hypothetical protein